MTVVLLAGVALALSGYFGPADGGFLELVGLVIVGVAVWKMVS